MWRVTTGSVHRPGNFWFSSWGWNDWDVCLLRRGQARWIHHEVNEKYQTSQLSGGSDHRSFFFVLLKQTMDMVGMWALWVDIDFLRVTMLWLCFPGLQVGHNPICYYKTLVFGLLKTPSSWGAGPSIGPTKILRNTPSTPLCQVKNATAVAKCAQQRSSFPQGGNARTIACNPGGPTDDGSSFVVMSFCYI